MNGRRVDEALRASPAWLEFALEAGRLGTWEWDLRSGEVRWSETLERIHGLAPGAFAGSFSAFQQDIHAEDRERVLRSIQRSVEAGRDLELEYRIVLPDGTHRWLLARGRTLRDDQGQPARRIGVCIDITERREAEEALGRTHADLGQRVAERTAALAAANAALAAEVAQRERAEARLRATTTGLEAVLTGAEALLACPDLDTLYRSAVEFARERLQLERCSIFVVVDGMVRGTFGTDRLGQTTDERTIAIPQAEWEHGLWSPEPEGPRWQVFQDTYRRWDGQAWVAFGRGWVVATPILQAANRPIGVFYNDTAISRAPIDHSKQEVVAVFCSLLGNLIERLRAEQALQENEARYRSLIERSWDFVLLADGDAILRYASPAVTRALGYTPAELVGRHAPAFVRDEHGPPVRAAFERALRQPGASITAEFQCRHRDGSWRWLEVVATNLLHEPAVRAVVLNNRDITERKALEERLRQAQKMEAVGQLAGGVAHEFNNLLAVVLGYSELLLDRVRDTEPQQRYLEQLQRAARRGAGLTEQILAFARKQLVTPQLLDLNRLVAEVAAMTAPLLGDQVHLSTSLEPLLGEARADPRQLELVLVNLLLNARDAMPDGGHITLRTANIELDPALARRSRDLPPGAYVAISVGDTGVGIAPEHLIRVFEPFFTTKEVGQGTGLGLATAYGIVRQSGGDLTVESQPGSGAIFTVYLPRVPANG